MKLCLVSDTHSYHRALDLPEADLLLHAGDITFRGELDVLQDFNAWLGEQKHKFTYGAICIFGNHDVTADPNHRLYNSAAKSLITNALVLEHETLNINGLNIFGSPWTPHFGYNWAWNYDRAEGMNLWQSIGNADIIITHGPPLYILDDAHPPRGEHVGCYDLGLRIREVKPKLCVFGHIHQNHGIVTEDGIQYANAAVLDNAYNLVYKPLIVEI